jgi:SnoaL-like domain
MSDLQTIADRVEIEALRAEFTDVSTMHDWDRFASLFTEDGAWRMPHINEELVSREGIRAGLERLRSLGDYFVQHAHGGTIQLDGDTAVGRAHIEKFGPSHGKSFLNHAIYHDRYHRTPHGWRFAERAHEVRSLDTTPLAGAPPYATGARHLPTRGCTRPGSGWSAPPDAPSTERQP